MKKFYSLVLMAAALLVSTNMWAQISLVYNEGGKADKTFTDLQAAIDYVAPGDSATITLTAPQNLSEGLLIPHLTSGDTTATGEGKIVDRAKQRICINLNGYNIETSSTNNHCVIALLKGVLRITGEGQVVRHQTPNYSGNWQRGAIVVSGADADRNNAGNDRSKQEWSVLYIDKDVTVYSAHAGTYGIGIQDLGNTAPVQRGFNLKFAGYKTKHPKDSGPMWNPEGKEQWSAFGVKLMIDGTVFGERRGINVLGNINQTPGIVENHPARIYAAYPYYDHNFPYIKVGSTANVYCSPSGITDDGNGGIYLGGWAVVDVHGAVHGQTGIMMKAGDVKLIDGKVYSDDNTTPASNESNYHGTVNGSGIFVESSASYAGESTVAITGDSYVAGASGSAIVDVCATSTTESTDSKVTNVTITGGTIVGGDEGAISLGTGTDNVTEISGGNVQGDIDVGHASDTDDRTHATIEDFLPKTGDYHTTTVTVPDPIDPSKTTTTVVVSEGAAPEAPAGGNMVSNQADSASIKWTVNTVDAIQTGQHLILKELEINTNGLVQTLTIENGATLEVGRVVLGKDARIIVEAGGKFIVYGEQGVVAPSVDNIVIETQEGNPAYFLFNPAVTSNRHPNATVEFISKSTTTSSTVFTTQRFGIPTFGALTSVTAKQGTTDIPTGFQFFNYEANEWQAVGYINVAGKSMDYAKMANPFDYYQMQHNTTTPGTVVTMKGQLVGNDSPELSVRGNFWNGYANSYMAPIDGEVLINAIPNTVQKAIYMYDITQDYATWEPYTLMDINDQGGIQPMQPFLIRNSKEAADVTVDYTAAVYNPAMGIVPNSAPARRNALNNITRVNIVVKGENSIDRVKVAESAMFSTEFDNGYEAEKFMNEGINMYVSADQKMAVIATDDLNNTYVGLQTVKGGNYTIEFANVQGEELILIDHETGAQVAMVEGNTYEFTADANSTNDYRFEIVEPAKLPTAIENTEAVKSAKGIYTITGQYMGEMNVWNSLPAGVYVVNGEKRVK